MAKNAQGIPVNGPAVLAIRLLLKASQATIARETGISGQYLGQLESGVRTSASVTVIEALAAALRVDPRAIMAVPSPAASTDSAQVTA